MDSDFVPRKSTQLTFCWKKLSLELKFTFKLESSERGWKCDQLFNLTNFSTALRTFLMHAFEHSRLESFLLDVTQFRTSQIFFKNFRSENFLLGIKSEPYQYQPIFDQWKINEWKGSKLYKFQHNLNSIWKWKSIQRQSY